ncbi:gametocyte-specific factor 1 isoform X1 [Epinephelus lanceolatus]|uniref:gametocyte-specific factor 1 isoform X1 n=2 Tax=Epinephelus lanceolatus TaxID=310571 RepID=UPI00144613C8|nr:gametocyte-specific factor 1 isoform X1 [Epinephelus lanceolatus]
MLHVLLATSWCDLRKSHKEMATSIRFGTTSGPCRTASEGRAQLAEETDERNCDPDKLLQCPFDKNHQIRACRFPYHLLKCRKNHPKLASELRTCPFNARHLVPKHELTYHTETCEDRISLDTEDDGSTNGYCKLQVPVSTWVNPDMTEDWDKEADDAAAPFVWGVNTALTQSRMEMRPTNNLGPSFRTPNSFPWSMEI